MSIQSLGFKILTRRRALGLSQKEVADHLGVCQSWFSKVEHGALEPSLVQAGKLSDLLMYPLSSFYLEALREPDPEEVNLINAWHSTKVGRYQFLEPRARKVKCISERKATIQSKV